MTAVCFAIPNVVEDNATTATAHQEDVDNAKRIFNDINEYLGYLAEILEDEVEEESDDEVAPSVQKFLSEYQDYLTTSNPQSILKNAAESDEESDGDASTISFASDTDTTCVESPLSTSPNDNYCFTTAYNSLKFMSQDSSKTKSRRGSVASRMSNSTKRKNNYRPNLWKYSSISTCNSLDMTPKALSSLTLSAPSKASISAVDETTNALATFSSDADERGSGDSFDSIKMLRSQLNGTKERGMIIRKDAGLGSRDTNPFEKLIATWSENIPFLSMFAPKEETSVDTSTIITSSDNNSDSNRSEDTVVESVKEPAEEAPNVVAPTKVAKVDDDNKVPPKKDQFKLFELFISVMTNTKAVKKLQ